MAGGWATGTGLCNGFSFGQNPRGDSQLTSITSGTTANAYGSWVQLSANTPSEANSLILYFGGGNYNQTMAFDIGVGAAGAEYVVASSLLYCANTSQPSIHVTTLPLRIPAGVRMAARAQSSSPYFGRDFAISGFADTYCDADATSAIDTYGFVSATTSGTAIDPGSTANTKGAYVQITAGTAYDLKGFSFYLDAQTTAASASYLLDVAIGASGSETVILSNYATYAGMPFTNDWSPYLSIPIAAGTRIAVRAQSSNTTAASRVFGFTLYGART